MREYRIEYFHGVTRKGTQDEPLKFQVAGHLALMQPQSGFTPSVFDDYPARSSECSMLVLVDE